MFNFVNILGKKNNLKKDWKRQSNKYIASANTKLIQIFYGTSPWKNISQRLNRVSSPDSIQKCVDQLIIVFHISLNQAIHEFNKIISLTDYEFALWTRKFHHFYQ